MKTFETRQQEYVQNQYDFIGLSKNINYLMTLCELVKICLHFFHFFACNFRKKILNGYLEQLRKRLPAITHIFPLQKITTIEDLKAKTFDCKSGRNVSLIFKIFSGIVSTFASLAIISMKNHHGFKLKESRLNLQNNLEVDFSHFFPPVNERPA
jgi:hypothetical protein